MSRTVPPRMKAALCDAPGAPLEIREIDTPEPARGELLVELESCGVCHSDLHLRDGQENLPADLYPIVVGHEGIGRVVRIGEGTTGAPLIGTRVGLPWLYDTCLACKPCRTGWETYCADQTARGVERHGAFAEYALLPASFAIEIPDAIDPVQGAPLLCAGLTAWAALARARLEPGCNVVIIGAGGLGQYGIMIAKARGARVIAVDRDPAKLETARGLGAAVAIPADEHAGAAIRQAGGADVVINFAPSPSAWPMIGEAVNKMADIVTVAMVHEPVPLSMMWLIDGGHRVFGSSVGTRQDTIDFLRFAAMNPLPIDIEAIPFRDADAALDRLKRGEVAGRLCIDFSL
ncbi:alcohol dehydrogenase catalytic domain-containing protein [Roseovarius spongiae]|nr:alcohol dehydrogenase catalytic domain-containing protein [Roseovarius spongiae]